MGAERNAERRGTEKSEWTQAENVAVPVSVHDAHGKEVVRAVISMYVSPKKES